MSPGPGRVRRRAVGPPGARPSVAEPRVDEPEPADAVAEPNDDERFHAERPPHHDREH